MIVLLNLILPTLILLVLAVGYHYFKKARTQIKKQRVVIITLFVAVLVVIVYGAIQPSYMPKGKAPVMSKVPVEYTDAVIQDRLLKPRTEAEAQRKVDEMLTVREEAKKILKENNKQ